MKIMVEGSFGRFVWELPPSLSGAVAKRAKLATEIGQKIYGEGRVPDMQRFIADELTMHVSAFLLTLMAVNLVNGPGGIVIQEQFNRGMQRVGEECHSTLKTLKQMEGDGERE